MYKDVIFLNYHLKKYPNMMSTDKVKLIYQGTMGPHHFGTIDKDKVLENLLKEIMEIPNSHTYEDIYEWVSEKYLRLNIFPFIEIENDYAYNLEYIANAFYKSQLITDRTVDDLKQNIHHYLNKEDYKNYSFDPVHHSKYYEDTYEPRYRLVSKEFLTFPLREVQLRNFVKRQNPYTIIALEGRCASGKNTITKLMGVEYTVLHMDDFFLPDSERTDARMKECGGNINYELVSETLDNVKEAWKRGMNELVVKAFDCKKQEYYYKKIRIINNKLILEGVYSSHPYFRDKIDKIAYIYVSNEDQINQLKMKNISQEYIDKYINEWMPLEDKYFESVDITSICDVII